MRIKYTNMLHVMSSHMRKLMCAYYIHIIRITTVFRLQWTRASCVYIINAHQCSEKRFVHGKQTETERYTQTTCSILPFLSFHDHNQNNNNKKKSVSLRKNQVYIKRNFLNLTIRLKIITSRLFLPDFRGEREREK